MKAKNFLRKIAVCAAFSVALVAGIREASAQTTNFSGLTGTAPYYSVSNMVLQGVGLMLSDKIIAGTATVPATNTYLNGTNYFPSAGVLIQGGVPRSRYVAFSITATTTNSSASGVATCYIDASTGIGDWTLIAPLAVTLVSSNIAGAGTNVDVGGFVLFRVRQVKCTETNYTTTIGVGLSSKSGI